MTVEINQGTGLSVLVDIGELMSEVGVPVYTYRNFPRRPGLTVEQSLASLGTKGLFADIGVQVPDSLVMDCVRLCCSLCLLENDPSIISPDVLADYRAKFEASGDQKTWTRPIAVVKSAGTSVAISRSSPITGARTWPWFGQDTGRVVPRDCSTSGERRASGGGGEVAEWVWGRVNVFSIESESCFTNCIRLCSAT